MKIKFFLLLPTSVVLLSWQDCPIKAKPPYILLISEPAFVKAPTRHGDSTTQLIAKASILNNTDDTLVYASWWGKESKFFQTDNKNMTVIDDRVFFGKSPIRPDTIWPHSSRWIIIYCSFKKIPDTTFNFRIGMNLLEWQKSFKTTNPNLKTIQKAPILWSDTEVFKTDKKHHIFRKTPEEYKKQCEKVFYPLTDDDRLRYTLNINPDKVHDLKDTVAYYLDTIADNNHIKGYVGKKGLFAYTVVPLKFSNNSDSTLTYMTWSCSWDETYLTNNKDVSLMTHFCTKNIPATITVPAHGLFILNIPMLFNKRITDRYKFKIGMTLLRSGAAPFFAFAEAGPVFRRDPKYVIWSNDIEVPAGK